MKRLGLVIFPLILAGITPMSSDTAHAASVGCTAANGSFTSVGGQSGSPIGENPIPLSAFEVGDTITVVVSVIQDTITENNDVYWDSFGTSGDTYFGYVENGSNTTIFSGPVAADIGTSKTFTFTVTQPAKDSGLEFLFATSYGAFTVSCGTSAGDGSALERIQQSGTLIAAQQAAATTVSSVRSQISSRLKSCSAANDTPYTKDAAVASCPLDTASVDVWGSLTHTGFTGDGEADHKQVNAYAGVDAFLTNNLVGGVFVGYEYSNTEFDSLNGELDGNGQSVGAYMGYTFSDVVKFDAGISHSWLSYDVSDSAASADFDAQRTLAFAGLSGAISVGDLLIEPTTDLLAVWQDEESYSDSLDADHDGRSFTAIRASAGTRFSFTDVGTENWAVTPYAGLYGDYWSTDDDAGSSADYVSVLEDFSGRVNGGLNFESRTHGIALDLNAEYSGIGDETGALSGRAGLTIGF